MSRSAVIQAAQRFSNAEAACEYWRTRDAYPYEKHEAAGAEQQSALSALMAAARTLPPVLPNHAPSAALTQGSSHD